MAVGPLILVPEPAAVVATQELPQDVRLELRTRGGRPIRLALPYLEALPGAAEDVQRLHEVLWYDLEHSMVFDMIDPAEYPDVAPGQDPPWAAWRQTPAEALILGAARRVGDRVLAEFRLYDVKSGRQVDGQRYTESLARIRYISHAFSDRAVLQYTGIRGVASTPIAFASDRGSPPGESVVKEIWIMDYDGQNQRRITHDNTVSLSPAFSPAGDRFAYVTYRIRQGIVSMDLYLAFRGGGVPRAVTTTPGLNNAPTFAPDGGYIAFSSSRDGNPEIYQIRPDGNDLQRLTFFASKETSPGFSPNGRQIAFTSDRSGIPKIYVMGVDGTNVRRLQTQTGWNDDPAWQPGSGELIAYAASTGGNNFDIFVYDLTTGRNIQLTSGSGRKEAPAWSPDGRQISFEFTRSGRTQIWAMGLDGSRKRMLTTEGNNQSPAWGVRP